MSNMSVTRNGMLFAPSPRELPVEAGVIWQTFGGFDMRQFPTLLMLFLAMAIIGTSGRAHAIGEGAGRGCEDLYESYRTSLIQECISKRWTEYEKSGGRRLRLGDPRRDDINTCPRDVLDEIDRAACALYASCKAGQNPDAGEDYENMVYNWCLAGEFTK